MKCAQCVRCCSQFSSASLSWITVMREVLPRMTCMVRLETPRRILKAGQHRAGWNISCLIDSTLQVTGQPQPEQSTCVHSCCEGRDRCGAWPRFGSRDKTEATPSQIMPVVNVLRKRASQSISHFVRGVDALAPVSVALSTC